MAEYRYIIPMIPPSNNEFIGRTNFRQYQEVKKDWARTLQLMCRPKPKEPIQKAIVRLMYYFKDRMRRDPDNYSGKMILDGLVHCGVLKDDSFGCIRLELEGGYDKANPRLEITVIVRDILND